MEIREWLDAHPKEVVILSFSHFLALTQELHVLLLATIRNIFTSKLCPKTVQLCIPTRQNEAGKISSLSNTTPEKTKTNNEPEAVVHLFTQCLCIRSQGHFRMFPGETSV